MWNGTTSYVPMWYKPNSLKNGARANGSDVRSIPTLAHRAPYSSAQLHGNTVRGIYVHITPYLLIHANACTVSTSRAN